MTITGFYVRKDLKEFRKPKESDISLSQVATDKVRKMSIQERFLPIFFKKRAPSVRPNELLKRREIKRLLSACFVMVIIGCGINAVSLTVFTEIMGSAIPVAGAGDITAVFSVFKTIGNAIIIGFQSIGSVVCLISFFKTLTTNLLTGQGDGVGNAAFKYGLGFAMFFIMPLVFEAISKAFGGLKWNP